MIKKVLKNTNLFSLNLNVEPSGFLRPSVSPQTPPIPSPMRLKI